MGPLIGLSTGRLISCGSGEELAGANQHVWRVEVTILVDKGRSVVSFAGKKVMLSVPQSHLRSFVQEKKRPRKKKKMCLVSGLQTMSLGN